MAIPDEPPDLHDQPADEVARGGELQADIGIIRETGVAGGLDICLLAPAANTILADRLFAVGGHGLRDKPADIRPRAVDDRSQPAHLLVELVYPDQLVGHGLGQSNSDSAPFNVGKNPGMPWCTAMPAGVGLGST